MITIPLIKKKYPTPPNDWGWQAFERHLEEAKKVRAYNERAMKNQDRLMYAVLVLATIAAIIY